MKTAKAEMEDEYLKLKLKYDTASENFKVKSNLARQLDL